MRMKTVIFSDLNNRHKQLANLKQYLIERTPEEEHAAINEAHDQLNEIIVKLYQRKHL